MKQIILLTFVFAFVTYHKVISQEYVPFSTDTVTWHQLFYGQYGPDPSQIYWINYIFRQQGDTVLKGKTYQKIYWSTLAQPDRALHYIGGLREDDEKHIWFFPENTDLDFLAYAYWDGFPSDTTEYLLYRFDDLEVGEVITVGNNNTLTVYEIDTIGIGSTLRKRYKISNDYCFMDYDYWIEGIGSSKSLFSPYSEEFEWRLHTLCYQDTATYYISSPDQYPYCIYQIVGIEEKELPNKVEIFPNPASQHFTIKTNPQYLPAIITLYDMDGKFIQSINITTPEQRIDIDSLKSGIYLLKIATKHQTTFNKLIVF